MNSQQPASMAKSQTEDGLPLEDYDSLNAEEILRKLPKLSPEEVEKLCHYEKTHENRKTLLRYFAARIGSSCCYHRTGRPAAGRGEAREEKGN